MKRLIVLAVGGVVAACGGGGGGSNTNTPAPPVAAVSPGGIWEGTDSVTGLNLLGLVSESGEFHFIRGDNVQFVGTATMTGSAISASYEAFTQVGTVFPDGTTHGTGTLSGTVQQRTSITGTSQARTDSGAVSNGTVNLRFNAVYNRPSSLATIAGNFREPTSGAIVSISSNGTAFSQDATTGCVLNGTVSIINATYNAYRVQWTYSSCRGTAASLNGVTFRGLGTLDNTSAPEALVLGAVARSGATTLAIVWDLVRA